MNRQQSVLLLGIGNVLWADEGFGVRVAEQLQKHYQFPGSIQVMDGGTQGMYLVQHVQQADVLIIFDAIDFGLPEATLQCLENDAVPNYLGAKKMSLHQTGFQEVLATAQMLGQYPQQLLLIGVQPVELEDYGGSLHDKVKAQISPAIDIAVNYLHNMGLKIEKSSEQTELQDPVLDIYRYEQERPSAESACRLGDQRVVQSSAFRIKKPETVDEQMLQVDVDYRGKY